MRKIYTLVLTFGLLLSFAGCTSNSSEGSGPSASEENSTDAEDISQTEEPAIETPSESETEVSSNSLVVYFSWSGNTESVANEIANQTGADIFEIIPVEPYTEDYDALLDIAQEEQANDVRPEIAETVEDFEQYDVVYLGYPNWWGDMPMIVYTFLEEYDLNEKKVAPFITSGGSGFSGTINTIESMEPDAVIVEGLSLGSSEASDPEEPVTQWLSAIALN